jgi:predicted ATPase
MISRSPSSSPRPGTPCSHRSRSWNGVQRLDLLKGGRDAEARQHTLRATIEWSHDLLADAEKQLFARLAVFAGGCTLDAAEEICGAELDVLQSLIDKSLLRHTEDRFWMLETIHEYAAEWFGRSPEANEMSSRHASWYADLANRAEEQMRGPEEADWLARLEVELGNLRATLAWLETKRAPTDFQKLAAASAATGRLRLLRRSARSPGDHPQRHHRRQPAPQTPRIPAVASVAAPL